MQTYRSQPFPGLTRNVVTTDDGSEVLATYYEATTNTTDEVSLASRPKFRGHTMLFLAASFLVGVVLGSQIPQLKHMLTLLAQSIPF